MTDRLDTILVTGAGGWIGRSVVERLTAHGLTVLRTGRNVPDGELMDTAAAAAVVVHAASGYSNARDQFVDGGLRQAMLVARACSRTENAVVFLSSAKVYGWQEEPTVERCCDESSACTGADNFTAAKRIAEELLMRAAARSTTLRISNVYGAGVPAKYAVGTMLSSAMRDRRITLDCTGGSRRDFVGLDDVVTTIERATLTLLRRTGPERLVVNVSSGRLVTLLETAQLVADVAGATVEVGKRLPISSPAISNRRAIEAGFIDRFIDPLDGLREMMRQWKEHPWQPI